MADLTDQSGRGDLIQLRGRYVELLRALQRTAEHNPETLQALEQIIPQIKPETLRQNPTPLAKPAAAARPERKSQVA